MNVGITSIKSFNFASLWNEYCKFYEQSFEEQLDRNRTLMKEHIKRWGETSQAKIICPHGVKSYKKIPVTTFADYPIFQQLKPKIESLEKTYSRKQGELYWDYYDRLGRMASNLFSDYIIGDFAFITRTTGTAGSPKWVAHGSIFYENLRQDVISHTMIACSDSWGDTKFRPGDKGLNFTSSAPFISGWGRKCAQEWIVDVPPADVIDNIQDTRRRFFAALEYLEKGHKVNMIGGIAPSVYLMCEYLSNPEDLFKEYYQSINIGPAKIYMLQKWAQAKVIKRSRNILDFLDLKGAIIAGVDTALYIDYMKIKLGVEPLCVYGTTETGISMFGSPDRKSNLFPNLRSCFFEFLDGEGELRDLKELKIGQTYGLVITPFGGTFVRYKIGDVLRVSSLRDDGMPIFTFWGRESTIIALGGTVPYITESMIANVMAQAGLSLSDKWAVSKTLEGREKLLILMENTWGLSETDAVKRLYHAFMYQSPDFKEYVEEFKISDPQEALRVEYLKKGAFLRYTIKRGKEGFPLGQVKPPKVITPERHDIIDLLRSV